jgi:rubrerythrin
MKITFRIRTEDRCKICNTELGQPPAEVCPYCGKNQEEEKELIESEYIQEF